MRGAATSSARRSLIERALMRDALRHGAWAKPHYPGDSGRVRERGRNRGDFVRELEGEKYAFRTKASPLPETIASETRERGAMS